MTSLLCEHYGLSASDVLVAVCGLRVKSEHEDECCVMIELVGEAAKSQMEEISSGFLQLAKIKATKGAKVISVLQNFQYQ